MLLKTWRNTPGTRGRSGLCDRTLAIKSRKNVRKITFFSFFSVFCFWPTSEKLEDIWRKKNWVNFYLFTTKSWYLRVFKTFYGQCLVTAAWAKHIPWSIFLNFNFLTSGNLLCTKICFPQYFGITRRYMQNKNIFLG